MSRCMIAALALICAAATSQAQNLSPEDLARRTIERRAVEAVIWGMPAVNFELMFQAMEHETKGTWNQIVYWSRPSDWKNQTLTPNPDTIYLMPFFSTKDGPVVMEIPPADSGSINGTIMESWQMPLEDVGPAGVDKGNGGKYLITPPGYAAKAPEGYIVLPSQTNYGYALLRANLKSDSAADVAEATAYGRRIKLYPLAQAANPPATVFVDAIDVIYDATIPYNARYFQALDRFVQREPWLTRDKAMIDQLKSVGIEKGKPFQPDAARERILNAAATEAGALLESFYQSAFSRADAFYPGGKWGLPDMPGFMKESPAGYTAPDSYPTDERGVAFTFLFFTPKHLGGGQFYLMTLTDKAGQKLSGASTYRLRVPANAPVKLYWSATLYDRASHALIRNVAKPSRSSLNPDQRKNADGSVDLYFGPSAPQGMEANWIPTDPKGEFEVLFRLYGPEPSFFEKKWVLPDIEKVAAQ